METKEDVRILYIDSFKYKDQEKAKWMHYKPAEGQLYRAFYAPVDGTTFYRILMEDETMEVGNMLLMDLSGDNRDWSWDITEVNDTNIADLPLEAEQYAQLAAWRDSKHSDIDKFRRENIETVTYEEEEKVDSIEKLFMEELREAMEGGSDDIAELEELDLEEEFGTIDDNTIELIKRLNNIKDVDEDMYFVLWQLVAYLDGTYGEKYETNETSMAKTILENDTYGKGASLFNSVKYIQLYLTNGYEKSENPVDLQKAIHYTLFELIRKTV